MWPSIRKFFIWLVSGCCWSKRISLDEYKMTKNRMDDINYHPLMLLNCNRISRIDGEIEHIQTYVECQPLIN